MKTPRNPDRLIRTYLQEDQVPGQPEVPDHVYNAIRDGIEQTRQRAVIGSMGVPDMNKFLAIGLGTAAVVVALLVGSNLIGSSSPAPGGAPSVSAEPSEAAPSAAPSTPADGSLPVGAPFAWLDSTGGAVPVTVTVPASGWHGDPGFFALQKNDGELAVLAFTGGEAWLVSGDGCNWESTLPDTPSATIDELVAALSAQASRDASAPVDIDVDGHAGKSITLHMPSDLAFTGDGPDCDSGTFCQWVDPELSGAPADTCARTAHAPDQVDELWIVEVNDKLVIINTTYLEETPDELVEEMRAIVDSITFE